MSRSLDPNLEHCVATRQWLARANSRPQLSTSPLKQDTTGAEKLSIFEFTSEIVGWRRWFPLVSSKMVDSGGKHTSSPINRTALAMLDFAKSRPSTMFCLRFLLRQFIGWPEISFITATPRFVRDALNVFILQLFYPVSGQWSVVYYVVLYIYYDDYILNQQCHTSYIY